MQTMSKEMLEWIKKKETLQLLPYHDSKGWSIGYGHYLGLIVPDWAKNGITLEYAEELFRKDILNIEIRLNEKLEIPLKMGNFSQNKFDSLGSLMYNCGTGRILKSTLMKKILVQDFKGAAKEFGRWVHVNGKVKEGLVIRRGEERRLFEL